MSKRLSKKVLLIGWDAAEWKVINPMIEQGLMPTLAQLIKNGVSGRIATLNPPLSPMLWTSIATGMTADKHGILGFIEPDAEKGGVRPVRSTSRKVKAIWNILNQNGLKSNVIGWWPSHPAEPINGVMTSNFFHHIDSYDGVKWPLAKGAVHPTHLKDELASLRIHPNEMTEAHVLPFIPNAAAIDQTNDKKIATVCKYISDCSTVHAAGTWVLENTEWDFTAIYYDAIDHFSHIFMKYHPPQMDGIPDDLFELFKEVVVGAYRYHDMMLERLLKLAGEDTTVILVSDHGFHPDEKRFLNLPDDPMAPAFEHSPYGVFCINGPSIQKNEKVYGASLLDITPTILTLFGLPIGKDMDGKALTQVLNTPVIPEYIDSWENVKGEDGRHPSEILEDPWEAKEAMKQLIELGYIEAPDEDKKNAVEVAESEQKYNLALTYLSAGKVEKAIPLLEELYNKYPQRRKYGLSLGKAYLSLQKISECRQLTNKLKASFNKPIPSIILLEGKILLEEKRFLQALECFKKVEELSPSIINNYNELGKTYLGLDRFAEAEKSFLKSIEIEGDHPVAHHGLGIVYKKMSRYEEAINEFLKAIDLLFFFPAAHYQLGETLVLLEHYEQAIEAFNICIKLSPGIKKAHQWLVKIYEEQYSDVEKANVHRKFMRDNIKDKIVIVSGLPRSGTSMMMQLLDAGGMPVLSDQIRKPDQNNPKGYFEFEPVKKMMESVNWVKDAQGKAVKVIAQLLQYLPSEFEYKIIFMKREMDQVLRSQQIMLKKESEIKSNVYPAVIANAFNKQLQQVESWLSSQPNIEVMYVNYSEVIVNPKEQAKLVSDFIEQELDLDEMAKAVDTTLYRNNKSVWI